MTRLSAAAPRKRPRQPRRRQSARGGSATRYRSASAPQRPSPTKRTLCACSPSPSSMIMCVAGAATASEMKAVPTSRAVIRMPDRPVVIFLAAACTGHYPGVRPGSLSAFSPGIPGNTPVRSCRFRLSRLRCPRCLPRPVGRADRGCISPSRVRHLLTVCTYPPPGGG